MLCIGALGHLMKEQANERRNQSGAQVGRIVRAIGQQGKTRERRTGGEFALTVAAWAVSKYSRASVMRIGIFSDTPPTLRLLKPF